MRHQIVFLLLLIFEIQSSVSTDDIFALLGCRKSVTTDFTSLVDLRPHSSKVEKFSDWECAIRVDTNNNYNVTLEDAFAYKDYAPEFVPDTDEVAGWRLIQWKSRETGEVISNPYHLEDGKPDFYSLINNTIILTDDLFMTMSVDPLLNPSQLHGSSIAFVDYTHILISLNVSNIERMSLSMSLNQKVDYFNDKTVHFINDESINITTDIPLNVQVDPTPSRVVYNVSALAMSKQMATIQIQISQQNEDIVVRSITTTHLIMFYLLVCLFIFWSINQKRQSSISSV